MKSDSALRPWIVCLSAALFFFFGYMQVNVFNSLNPYLYKAFHLTDETQLGRLSAMYFYSNVIFLFPAGIILDYISTRKLMLWMMALCTICTFLFAFTHFFWQAELIRFLIGIWGAFFLLSNIRLASRWFPPQKMALVVGIIVTLAMLGGMVAQTPLTLMAQHFGWRPTMMADAALGLVVFIIMALFVRDNPPGQSEADIAKTEHTSGLGFWKSLAISLKNTQNWLAGIYASMLNLPLFFLGASFGILYLVQVYGLTSEQASFVIALMFFGVIVGSPVVGWFSDRIRQRKMPMIIGAVLMFAVILMIIYIPHLSLTNLYVLFFVLGFTSAFQVIAYPLVAESNPASLTGTSEGIASVLIMGGGVLLPLFPYLLDMDWNHTLIHHLPHYSIKNFDMAMLIMPVAFAIAFVASLLLRETHCLALHDQPDMADSNADTLERTHPL